MINKLVLILIIPFLTAGLSYYVGKKSEKIRDLLNVIFTSLVFILIIMLYPEVSEGTIEYSIHNIMGTGLHLKVDMLRYAMLFISGLAWFLATMFSTQYITRYRHRNRYYMFFMLTYAFTLGVFMSDNILNLFTFFEGMSLASYALVIHDEDQFSHDAGISYLSMGLAGGLILLMGIFLAFDYTNTLEIGGISKGMENVSLTKQYILGTLFIIGFGIKASMFPLHTWLPQTYAAAPVPATAILSAVLLKTGLFGVIITILEILNGNVVMSYVVFGIGLINILLGGFFALMQRNIKRIIAYSSMSQTGFILLGIGLVGILGNHGGIALLGTIMYMINHAFFKLLLFFGAGAIYMILKEMSLNVIWGFGRHKNKLKIFFLIGVFGITGVPGFNGYTSKTLIHEAIIEAQHLTHSNFFSIAEMIFYIGGAMTVAYMLKLFVAIFVDENKNYYGQYKNQLKKRAQLPMMILSLIIILIGIFPNSIVKALGRSGEILTYRIPTEINFFTYEALISSIIILLFGGFIYLFAVRRALIVKKDNKLIFLNPSYNWFGLEKDLYYPLFMSVFKGISLFFKFIDVLLLNIVNVLIKISTFIGNIDKVILPKLEWDKMIVVIDFKKMDTDINGRIIKKSALAKEKYTSEKENIKNRLVEGKEKINENKEIKNQRLKDIVENYNIKLSSITFSVFLIGFVIVMSYLFIFII